MSFKHLRLLSFSIIIGSFCGTALAALPKVMPVADLQPGTKAIGFSVFKGVEPEPFNVVLGNTFSEMGETYVLMHISGGPMETPLEKTGAIAGMSGSPIFIFDDKLCHDYKTCVEDGTGVLVGALSIGIGNFILDGPNAGLTPAEYMLGNRFNGYRALAGVKDSGAGVVSPKSGFSPGIKDLFLYSVPEEMIDKSTFSELRNRSSIYALAGSSSPSSCTPLSDKDLKTGSMISIYFATGDIPLAVSGTVTWRDGGRIFVFGHPMFGDGLVSYPFSQVAVSDVIQTPLSSSKIPGCSVGNEGSILFDASKEVAGLIGQKTNTIPMEVNVSIGNKTFQLHENVVPGSPFTDVAITGIPSIWVSRIFGDISKFALNYHIRVILDNQPEIYLENRVIAKNDKDNERHGPLDLMTRNLMKVRKMINEGPFRYKNQRIEMSIDISRDVYAWTTENVFWQNNDRYSDSITANPGDTVVLSVMLRRFPESGDVKMVNIPITVPKDFLDTLPEGAVPTISVAVQGGDLFRNKKLDQEPTPTSLADYIKLINKVMGNKNDTVYVQTTYLKDPVQPTKDNKPDTDKPKAEKKQNLSLKWQAIDPQDVVHISPPDPTVINTFNLPPLDGVVGLDKTMLIKVEKPSKKEIVAKRKKLFGIF